MRRSLIVLVVILLGLLLATGFGLRPGGGERAARQRLVLTGSSTIAPLAAEMARRFESLHPGVRVDVQTGGSSRGITDARQGVADIGMVSRALKDTEADLLAFSIARDGIAVIVHASNPVPELTDDQVRALFTGKISRWTAVGGPDIPVTVVNKAEGRSTLELFLTHFGLRNADVRAHVVIGDNEQGVKSVAANPGAIGYVSIGTAEHSAAAGVPIRLLPAGGVAPVAENVRNGSFPLARPLNLVSRGRPEGLAREFIEFARSPAASDLVGRLGFVPLGE